MTKVKEILSSFTADTTIEEARRLVAEALEETVKAEDDITALNITIEELKSTAIDSANEIDRLKEENGRLYRDRTISIIEKVEEKQDDVNDIDKQIAELESEIIL